MFVASKLRQPTLEWSIWKALHSGGLRPYHQTLDYAGWFAKDIHSSSLWAFADFKILQIDDHLKKRAHKINNFFVWKNKPVWICCLCGIDNYKFNGTIDIKRKNRLQKVCYVPTTSATFLAFFSFFLAVAIKSTNETNKQAVCAINYSIFLRCPWMEQHTSKNVNNCLNTNLYSYLETSSGQSSNVHLNVVSFFNTRVN